MSLSSKKTSHLNRAAQGIAALLWVSTIQFYFVQIIVARAWQSPAYDVGSNFISNLGSVICDERVCSPLYPLMNVSFIVLGISILTGALIFAFLYRQNNGAVIGFLCLALSGLGTIFVGVFPIGTNEAAHSTGAFTAFLVANVGLVILGIALHTHPLWVRLTGITLGGIALLLLPFYINQIYFGLGVGYIQRPIAYAQTLFMICFGAYTLYSLRSHNTK